MADITLPLGVVTFAAYILSFLGLTILNWYPWGLEESLHVNFRAFETVLLSSIIWCSNLSIIMMLLNETYSFSPRESIDMVSLVRVHWALWIFCLAAMHQDVCRARVHFELMEKSTPPTLGKRSYGLHKIYVYPIHWITDGNVEDQRSIRCSNDCEGWIEVLKW